MWAMAHWSPSLPHLWAPTVPTPDTLGFFYIYIGGELRGPHIIPALVLTFWEVLVYVPHLCAYVLFFISLLF